MKKFVLAFAILAVIVSCKKTPTSCFTTSPPPFYVGNYVSFASCSEKATGLLVRKNSLADYRWDFGDGTLGSGESTSHYYNVLGTFTITLKVTDEKGRTGSSTQSITIQ